VSGVIRDSIGFAGLLMTDDISMGALSGSIAERTHAAIAAGCDVVLHCNGQMPEMEAVAAQAPVLAGAALARAKAALASRTPPPIDVAPSRATFLALMNGVWEPVQGYV
jgi:beta-N-acetylhexosaminidase